MEGEVMPEQTPTWAEFRALQKQVDALEERVSDLEQAVEPAEPLILAWAYPGQVDSLPWDKIDGVCLAIGWRDWLDNRQEYISKASEIVDRGKQFRTKLQLGPTEERIPDRILRDEWIGWMRYKHPRWNSIRHIPADLGKFVSYALSDVADFHAKMSNICDVMYRNVGLWSSEILYSTKDEFGSLEPFDEFVEQWKAAYQTLWGAQDYGVNSNAREFSTGGGIQTWALSYSDVHPGSGKANRDSRRWVLENAPGVTIIQQDGLDAVENHVYGAAPPQSVYGEIAATGKDVAFELIPWCKDIDGAIENAKTWDPLWIHLHPEQLEQWAQ